MGCAHGNAVGDCLGCDVDELCTLGAESDKRLAHRAGEMHRMLRALVESLPKCTVEACGRPATKAFTRGGSRYCDECDGMLAKADHTSAPDYPRAGPLRDAMKLLGG